jgi:hypothetical protein
MEFVTIHDLSRALNIPARVIRYRLMQLIAEQKLKEHDDFRRDDFKDDQHFVWKIHPLRFMQQTGFKPATLPPAVNNVPTTANKPDNQSPLVVNQPVNESQKPDAGVDTKPQEPSLAREMIDLLKEQIDIKDGQLKDQGEQLKETHELNLKLIGTTLQQSQKIEKLLRLTGGKTELVEVDDKDSRVGDIVDNQSSPIDTNTVNQSSAPGYQTGNDGEVHKTG